VAGLAAAFIMPAAMLTIQNLSTNGVGSGIENIPFLGTANPADPVNPTTANAFVFSAAATFWIEWVRIPGEHPLGQRRGGPGQRQEGEGIEALRAIEPFWDEPTFLQLQYSQVVILIFNGVLWPHVTVATLTLSAG
jgi:hypothetical protein